MIVGDINDRHVKWDKITNGRGIAVMEVAHSNPRTYVLAADKPSYYKVITREGGKQETWSSNPDIAILRTHDATVYINERDWTGVSDHRPVTFTVKAKLKLKELKRRVAKSLLLVPSAIKEAKAAYVAGIDEILDKLENCKTQKDETHIQQMYKEVDQFITGPW